MSSKEIVFLEILPQFDIGSNFLWKKENNAGFQNGKESQRP